MTNRSTTYRCTKGTEPLERLTPAEVSLDTYLWHICRYKFASTFAKEKIVLDVGCGTGYGSYYLAGIGAKKVIGLDVSKDAIKYSKENYDHFKISFIRGNAENLPVRTNSLDVIISFETIEHLNNPEQFLSECSDTLKKDGLLIVSTPNKRVHIMKSEHNPYHIREFLKEEFISILKKEFEDITLFGQRFLQIGKLKKKIDISFFMSRSGSYIPNMIKSFLKPIISSFSIKINPYYFRLYSKNVKDFDKRISSRIPLKYKVKYLSVEIERNFIPGVLIVVATQKRA